jgi:hypothetical protein
MTLKVIAMICPEAVTMVNPNLSISSFRRKPETKPPTCGLALDFADSAPVRIPEAWRSVNPKCHQDGCAIEFPR